MLDIVNADIAPEVFQTENVIRITIDRSRDDLLTEFGKATLSDRYLMPNEEFQDLFARVASSYADDSNHAQRLYDYMSNLWFMPSTPVLSNGGTRRGLPISCFLNEANDSLEGILETLLEYTHIPKKKTFYMNTKSNHIDEYKIKKLARQYSIEDYKFDPPESYDEALEKKMKGYVGPT